MKVETTKATETAKAEPACFRCGGRGVYMWGAIVNGVPQHSGPCYACKGGGMYPPTQGSYRRKRKPARREDYGFGLWMKGGSR